MNNTINPSFQLNCQDISFSGYAQKYSKRWVFSKIFSVDCSIERDQCMKGHSAPC